MLECSSHVSKKKVGEVGWGGGGGTLFNKVPVRQHPLDMDSSVNGA